MTAQSFKKAILSDVGHVRVYYDDSMYAAHPNRGGIWNFGNGEIAVLHKHAPCDYASRYSVDHGVVHSRARVVMQRSLDSGETWEEGLSVVWDETAPLETRMAFLHAKGPRPEIDLDDPDTVIYFGRTRRHTDENESNMDLSVLSPGSVTDFPALLNRLPIE